MKTCPKCRRTFEDSYSFCLEDGTVLSSGHSEIDDEIPTRVINKNSQAGQPTSFWKYAFVSLFLLFLFGSSLVGILVYINLENNTDSENPTSGNKEIATTSSTPIEEKTEKKTTETPTPMTENVSLETPQPPETRSEVNKLDRAVAELKQEMSYANARKMLINAGWQAVVSSPNREKFGSEEYIFDTLKFTEVESCSGTGMGYCRFLFRDLNNRNLVIITIGNEEGVPGGPTVNSWRFEK